MDKINFVAIKDPTLRLSFGAHWPTAAQRGCWATSLGHVSPLPSPSPPEVPLSSYPSGWWPCCHSLWMDPCCVGLTPLPTCCLQTCQSVAQIKLVVCYSHLIVISLSLISPRIPWTHYMGQDKPCLCREKQVNFVNWDDASCSHGHVFHNSVPPLWLFLFPFRKQHCFPDRGKGLGGTSVPGVPYQSTLEVWPQKGWKLPVCSCFDMLFPPQGGVIPSVGKISGPCLALNLVKGPLRSWHP